MADLSNILSDRSSWLGDESSDSIVVSSRIRLARNLANRAFPGWAGGEECVKTSRELQAALSATVAMRECHILEMTALSPLDRDILRERHLMSNEMAVKGRGSALALQRGGVIGVMINEEDHLRIQALQPGANLEELWTIVDALDNELAAIVSYAYSSRLGYLTACPTNLGTGLRASMMLHLPGLAIAKEIEPVIKGLNKIGLTARGLLGEGTDAMGNMFQVSNQVTLGESEKDILRRLKTVIGELIEHERNARQRLLEQRPVLVRDFIGRAYGTIMHAGLLTSREALDLLSAMNLGRELGVVENFTRADANRLIILAQPAHLQKHLGCGLDIEERDAARARLLREEFRRCQVQMVA